MLAALGAFLGHLFPVWLKFKGGKGVAVYIGVLIGLFWPAAVVFCVIWLATAVTSRYSSLSALVASFVTPIFLWWFGHLALASLFAVLTLLLFYMHRENIKRLQAGTEGRIGAEVTAFSTSRPRQRLLDEARHRQRAGVVANRAITCTPTGNPPSATVAGTLTQGVPIKVQSRLKRGSPVEASPFGAAPGAENVSNTSTSSNISANACRARFAIRARLVVSGRRDARGFRRACRATAAAWRRNSRDIPRRTPDAPRIAASSG